MRLVREGDDWVATSNGNQSSGVFSSLTRAQGLLAFPAEASQLRKGDRATVQLLDDGFLSSATPGF